MKNIKKVIAGLMAATSLVVGMTGFSASAYGSFCNAYCANKQVDGLTYYRGVGEADGTTFRLISGYINSSGGKVYANGSPTWMATPWVAGPATSGTGEFTVAYSNGVTFTISY